MLMREPSAYIQFLTSFGILKCMLNNFISIASLVSLLLCFLVYCYTKTSSTLGHVAIIAYKCFILLIRI